MGKKVGLSMEERREAVLGLLRREEPTAVLARRYGIAEATLYRWRDEFLAAGMQALEGKPGRGAEEGRIRELEAELEERDRVIGELTIANRILKKRSDSSYRTKR